jgi:hypothetical protein
MTTELRNEPISDEPTPAAEYRCTVEPRAGYLYISVSGENTVANVRRILSDVLSACAQRGRSRVLLEEHLSGPSLGMVEAFEIVSEGSASARSVVQQIAYVDTNPEHDSSLLDFVETVAVNRGVHVRVFATVPEAEAWLDSLPAR